ncbi:hypothetical protein HanRHA438_Chr08g0368131 [Helianthus annuus]|nr:hypothetical protein HanRHA438_Chr08g0368131 [Helianthus annuus]
MKSGKGYCNPRVKRKALKHNHSSETISDRISRSNGRNTVPFGKILEVLRADKWALSKKHISFSGSLRIFWWMNVGAKSSELDLVCLAIWSPE